MIRKFSLLGPLLLVLLVTGCQQKEKENLSQFVADAGKMKAK